MDSIASGLFACSGLVSIWYVEQGKEESEVVCVP